MAIVYLSCAWVAGIFLGSIMDLPPGLIFTGLVPISLILFFREHKKTIILISLCIIALIGGTSRFESSLPTVDASALQYYNERGTVEIEGVVATAPEVRATTTHVQLTTKRINYNGEWHEAAGVVLMFVPRYATYEYGDVLLVTGELETPVQFAEFDYRDYLAHQGIYSTMVYPQVEVIGGGEGLKLLEWVYSLRKSLAQKLTAILPEPQASLAQGIILGMRGNIPSSLRDSFSQTGTAHLLAISGLHLSIMTGILLGIGIWFFGKRRYIYAWLTLGMIWVYVLLTGMHPPVVRGAIMVSLFLVAEILGRQRSSITAIAFAAAVMIGISPQILWDASFQLSFMAMVGLIFITPYLQNWGRKVVSIVIGEDRTITPFAYFTADSFGVTLGAIIAIWPLVAYYFGIISFAGPLATFLAMPVIPGIIVSGLLAAVTAFAVLPLAQVFGWTAWLFLSYLVVLVNGFTVLPLSYIESGPISPVIIVVYYAVLAAVLFLANKGRLTRLLPGIKEHLQAGAFGTLNLASGFTWKWAIPPLTVAAIMVSWTAASMPDDNLHVSFLDVGQGDAILIQQGSQQILVDGGPSPQDIGVELGERMPFWDRTIELVILTHPSADHVTGLIEVLDRYEVEQVLYPDLDFDSDVYKEWLGVVEEKEIKCTIAQNGQQMKMDDGVVIEVLNPGSPLMTGTESDVDNNGVVLHLSKGEVSFLLAADIMWEAEMELIFRRADLNSTVLKIGHHGSDTSTTREFLAVVDPQLAVISVGAENKFGHPVPEVVARLNEQIGSEHVYRTDINGTVEFITDGKSLWVITEKR